METAGEDADGEDGLEGGSRVSLSGYSTPGDIYMPLGSILMEIKRRKFREVKGSPGYCTCFVITQQHRV